MFSRKHGANKSFVGITKDYNSMNQTTFVEKKIYRSKSYTTLLDQTSSKNKHFTCHVCNQMKIREDDLLRNS
jgi:molybdopterin synthase catalytic subunit